MITAIINGSLTESKVPLSCKKAIVRPLLKNKFRQGFKELPTCFCAHHLHDNLQSAYRSCLSTETVLLRVHHDITMALDKCKAALELLDLSAAFDVIDQGILYERLEHSYGICNEALNWIQSYLSNITQCVAIGSCTSTDKHLNYLFLCKIENITCKELNEFVTKKLFHPLYFCPCMSIFLFINSI